jgi:hypothetical protein
MLAEKIVPLKTSLEGRLRNTPLGQSRGLLALFEAVVNSIHAIEETKTNVKKASIEIQILRSGQEILNKKQKIAKRGLIGFTVTDNGIGFTDDNYNSFLMLDSLYKQKKGCRGVGRLLWLKVFEEISIQSGFYDEKSQSYFERQFQFHPQGVRNMRLEKSEEQFNQTIVHLSTIKKKYQKGMKHSVETIAQELLEHCLCYFLRQEGVPCITLIDEDQTINLSDLFQSCRQQTDQESFTLKGESFQLSHILFSARMASKPSIGYVAAGRLVEKEPLAIQGLPAIIHQNGEDFYYLGFVQSPFLDATVSPERTGFETETPQPLFDKSLTFEEVKEEVNRKVKAYFQSTIDEHNKKLTALVQKFVEEKQPRYHPILKRTPIEKLGVSLTVSDKDLELACHRAYADIEETLLAEGHDLTRPESVANIEDYEQRLQAYLQKAEDIKKSDLAGYVSHRRVILDLLKIAINRKEDEKYVREKLIHRLIMPLNRDSTDLQETDCNLWIIDERLAFHHFLASNKELNSVSILSTESEKKPDIFALNLYDNPLLINLGEKLPLASITVIEIKRPMRNDAVTLNEEKDPISQTLNYLEKIREGKIQTCQGRLIPESSTIPGFCYILCDLTPSVQRCCKQAGLIVTQDKTGYFGYNQNYHAYIEVISFDQLLNRAEERNRAFFEKLGLPAV